MILLYAFISIYTLIEATAFLISLRLLPLPVNIVGYVFLSSVIIGVVIERNLSYRMQKRPPLYIMSYAYPLPVIACLAGMWVPWLMILSVFLFAGLIIRIVFLLHTDHTVNDVNT